MILELLHFAFVATFVALAAIGHVLLFGAIHKCLRNDGATGRRFKSKLPSRRLLFYREADQASDDRIMRSSNPWNDITVGGDRGSRAVAP
jgi:hypothetical protein